MSPRIVRLISGGFSVCIAACLATAAYAQAPVAGPNVNMVSGTKWPQGDPFLTKQNEPSLAVSSRNPRHLLAGSNDYRLVAVEIAEALDEPEAWIQIYKSVDGGASWRATPLGGCPIAIPECTDSTGLTSALLAKHPNFGADPTVRAGPYGTFFLSFIAGTRNNSANGVVAVQRFVDKNNDVQRATDVRSCTSGTPGCVAVYDPPSCTGAGAGCTLTGYVKVKAAEDPILPDVLNIIDVGTPGQSKDKPWVAADVGGRSWNAGKTCELLSWTKSRPDIVTNAAEPNVPAFNVYVTYANFNGGSNTPDIYASASSDCGKTFAKPIKLTNGGTANQGTSSAIDPLTGAVYVVWRSFAVPGTTNPNAVMLSKSTDGGATWSKKPVVVAVINPYDQGATGVSFRTLDFPSVAVSVKNGVSRVHVAWSQRKVAPNATAPYACPSANPADCDSRIVVATSTNGGTSFPAAVPVDPNPVVPGTNPGGRGHQVQTTLTFAAGRLLATWLDQRQDHSEGYLKCPNTDPTTCTNVSQLVEARRPAKNSNLDPNCHIDVSQPPLSTLSPALKAQLDHCNNPAVVWTTYITDGTTGLVRRHTLDAYTAIADPADVPVFTSTRVSQYTFGTTVQGTVAADGTLTPVRGVYDIVQKEINPPNLPMFSSGKSAFIGDYIDSAGQIIVATSDPAHPYKFNVGGGASGPFVASGLAPAFHVAFTDNRDVIPPLSGDWTSPTCITTAFKKDANGNITGVDPTVGCGSPGYAGNRNQNVYTAAVVENSAAFATANSKLLSASTQRGFSVTVRNLGDVGRYYKLTLLPAAGVTTSFDSSLAKPTQNIFVQPRSASARTVWLKGPAAGTAVVDIKSTDSTYSTPDGAFASQVLLNPDPKAALVTNGDNGALPDNALDNFGSVVLSNAVLTNNVLSNNALSNAVLSNNALTNAALSNVVLSNAVLSNLDAANAALSNNALTNAALSNVVLSNAALSNNSLSNAVLSNVVLSNNVLNAALTNVDPANVALSNAVLSNNALSNVALSNNALSNVMLTNNALTNAVLSNVVLSNNALSNNALSNDSLRYVALSNAPLADASHGTDPDADPLRGVEPGAIEIAKNPFLTGDLANSNFKETTFTIRNHGNIDTTLAIKLMLRDAICTGAPSYTCTTPPGYKLQLVLRKVALLPVAIPPTGPAVATNRAIRIGLAQSNTEVSNVSDLPLIDPSDPNFGKFLPDDPNAAMLTLASGEYAYATIRAIGVGGATPPDPADLLRWGVKTVATNATTANGPLVIRTLNFAGNFVALTPASPAFQAFGGVAPITGAAVCSDKDGNTVLNGVNAPTSNLGVDGNFYIDTVAQQIYGPKTSGAWGSPSGLIVNGPSGPQASVPCPPGSIAMGAFATDASFNSTTNVQFTPKYWGDFFMLANVGDASSPQETDRQVIKVTVLPRPPVLTYTNFPTTLVYNNNGASIDLRPFVTSDSKNGAAVAQAFVFSASGSCHVGTPDNYDLFIDRATVPPNGAPDCIVTVHQDGNEIYAPVTDVKQIYIDRAAQTINSTTAPADNQLTFQTGGLPFNVAGTVTSTTAPASGLAVTFTATTTPLVCSVDSATGALTINGAGTCTIAFDQGGSANYYPAPQVVRSFLIAKANQVIGFSAVPVDHQITFQTGGAPTTLVASVTSPTAPPSGITVTFASTTPSVCTSSGANGSIITIIAAGTCSITADAAGNTNYNAAAQMSRSFVVDMANQVITFGAAPSNVTYGNAPVTVSATSSSPTAPPSGIPITFSSQTVGVCTNVGTTVTIVSAGTCTIAADQLGNANYNPAPQALQSFVIQKADQTIVFGAAPSGLTFGDPSVTVSASSTSPTAPPSGIAITFSSQTSAVCTNVGTSVTIVGAGTCTIAADQTGNTNYNAAPQVTQSFSVAKAPTQITIAPTVLFTPFGSATQLGGKVNRPGLTSVFPPGPVSIVVQKGANPPAATFTPNTLGPDGVFSATDGPPPAIASDSYTVTFSYGGDSNFLPATAVMATLRIEGFSSAGNMLIERSDHATVLLSDGRAMVIGGLDTTGAPTNKADVYCPDTLVPPPTLAQCPNGPAAFTAMDMPAGEARAGHTATLLGNGTVLVVGGGTTNDLVWDPATNLWSIMAMPQRSYHTATRLPNGKVLVAGGVDTAGNVLATTLIYDPVTGFASGPALVTARDRHTATLLADGTVLIAGGRQTTTAPPFTVLASAEIYDPGTNTMSAAAPMSVARFSHRAELLDDGRVLVAGGSGDGAASPTTSLTSTELYTAAPPAGGAWAPPAGALLKPRREFAMSKLTDSWVIALGGVDAAATRLAGSEFFEPGPGFDKFYPGPSMVAVRSGHTATRLQDGRVLILGGKDTGGVSIKSAEFYNGPY